MSRNSSNQNEQRALVRPDSGPKRSKSLGRRMAEQERELTDQMAEKRKRRRAARVRLARLIEARAVRRMRLRRERLAAFWRRVGAWPVR